MPHLIQEGPYERHHLLKVWLVDREELLGESNDGGSLLERSLIPSARRLSQIFFQESPFVLSQLSEPGWSFFQQECHRLHCRSEHLFRLAPFRSILCGKETGGAAMHGHDPVPQGALQGKGSALMFQFIQVHKISGERISKLPEIVESGPSQNSSPSIMLWSGLIQAHRPTIGPNRSETIP